VYKLKVSHRRHVCNCWQVNNVSYKNCKHGCDVFTPYFIRLGPMVH
jgi:hypothetical protein